MSRTVFVCYVFSSVPNTTPILPPILPEAVFAFAKRPLEGAPSWPFAGLFDEPCLNRVGDSIDVPIQELEVAGHDDIVVFPCPKAASSSDFLVDSLGDASLEVPHERGEGSLGVANEEVVMLLKKTKA